MTPFKRIALLAGAMLGLPGLAAGGQDQAPQYVVISFDGAHDNALWARSRALAAETGARFTYFLSCVYLLTPETRGQYQAPHHRTGRSNVGFGQTVPEVSARLEHVWAARAEGHEIASHGCGHFDGKAWSKADWLDEFGSFTRILRDAYVINGIDGEPEGWRDWATSEIRGFRAPYLSTSEGLDPALRSAGFAYDASRVSRDPAHPDIKKALSIYALPMVPEGPRGRHVIAMDYNLFVRHSDGVERAGDAAEFSERTYRAFRQAYDAELAGERRPLQLGFHFTLMNGGAYWHALERFAREVCQSSGTRCVSYGELDALLREPSGAAGG